MTRYYGTESTCDFCGDSWAGAEGQWVGNREWCGECPAGRKALRPVVRGGPNRAPNDYSGLGRYKR